MKNKLLCIIVLLCAYVSFSQDYGVWMTSRDYFHVARGDGRTSHAYFLQVANVEERENILTPGRTTTFTNEIGIHKKDDALKPFKLTSRIFGMLAGSNFFDEKELIKYERYVGGGSPRALGGAAIFDLLNTTSNDFSDIEEFYFYSIVLPYYVQPGDDQRTKQDLLFRTQDNIFTDPVIKIPEIVWKYNYDNKGYKEFPNEIKHDFPMKSKVEEILKTEVVEAGKILIVKAELDNSILVYKNTTLGNNTIGTRNAYLPVISSGELIFNTIESSPKFIDAIPKPITCNYKEDGSFELIVGRNINANEKLAVTIYESGTDRVPGGGQNLNIRRANMIDNLDGTYSYKWPNVLPAGDYDIKYQTGETSEDFSNTFDSLEVAGEIIIGSPTAVTYSLTQAEDKTCFTEDDGYIDVKADGHNGRTFFYQYKKNGVVQIIGGTDWIPFTNAKTTTISQLGVGNYTIKVRDSKGCFYRK